MTFKDGNSGGDWGGGMAIESSALVSIQTCKFVSCYAGGQGGGGIYALAKVDIFTTTFADNSVCWTCVGYDIATSIGGDVTIHSTCPPYWTGNPTEGSDLLWRQVLWQGEFSGTMNNFDLG